jgi:uncharacterized membrane protein
MQLGAVELLVIGFPENQFTGEIVPALADLVDKGTIRLIDVVFVSRENDGSVIGLELSSVDDSIREAFSPLLSDPESLIHDEDIADVAEALDPGSSVALVLFEHTWANGFRRALVEAGGELIDSFRIAPEAIDAAQTASEQAGA